MSAPLSGAVLNSYPEAVAAPPSHLSIHISQHQPSVNRLTKKHEMRGHRPQLFVASCRAFLQDAKPQTYLRRYGTVSDVPTQPSTTPRSAFDDALEATAPRNNWTKDEIKEIYDTPLMKLAFASVSCEIAV